MQTSIPGESDPSLLGRVDRGLYRLESLLNFLAGLAVFGLMFLGVAQVLGRKVVNLPMTGYVDFVEQAIAVFAFLGIAYCQRLGGHIRMELVLGKLQGRLLWLAEVVGILATLFIISVLIQTSYEHFLRAWEYGDTTIDIELPVWPSKLIVPVAFSVLWLRLLVQLWGYLRLFVSPSLSPVGVPVIASAADLARHEIEEALGGLDDPPTAGRGG